MSVKLHAHQEVAVEKMHNGCVLYGGVGVGKTITSLGYYFSKVCGGEINKWGSMQTPKDVYVITTAKVRDTKGFELQAAAYGVHQDPTISTNGVKITVDSWNNLHKYVEVKDAFFIFDEQRVVGYGAWSRAFIKVAKHNEWILLSATPGDTWLDYIPVFIANGWYKHKTDFVDQHVVWTPRVKYPKVLRYQNVGTLVRRRNDVLVHMPYERHTKRHHVDIWCDYDEDLFEKAVKKRWHVYKNRPLRDVGELFSVMRRIVNSDASRVETVGVLLKTHPKLIVFYNFDYELEMLRELGASLSTDSTSLSTGSTATRTSETSGSTSQKTAQTTSHAAAASEVCQSESLGLNSTGSETTTQPTSVKKLLDTAIMSGQPEDQKTTGSSGASNVVYHKPSTSTRPSTDCSNPQTPHPNPPFDCQGHWTTDRGQGETLLSCEQYVQALQTSRRSSKETSTSDSPTSSEPGSTQTGSSFAMAEWNGHKHQEIPTTDRWLYAVQYRAGAEGWNCIETDAICFYSQTYSYRDWWQGHGRIDRINTKFVDLWYYHLVSRSIIDKAIRMALKAKKSFNERDLAL